MHCMMLYSHLIGEKHVATRERLVEARFHADRTAGGNRHHRRPDRPASPRRPEGPRGRGTDPEREQPQTSDARCPQLPRRPREFPASGWFFPGRNEWINGRLYLFYVVALHR